MSALFWPTQKFWKQGSAFFPPLILDLLLFQNVRIYSKCPKRYFNQIYLNTTTSNTRIKSILRLCMPKIARTWMKLHFLFIHIKKCKLTYRPSQFSSQKGKKTLYFLRPNAAVELCLKWWIFSWFVLHHFLSS